MPMRGELPVPAMRPPRTAVSPGTAQFVLPFDSSELTLILCFCLIGLLATLFVLNSFADLGVPEFLDQFP